MEEIRFDTGVVSFEVNGAVTIEFNPTDSAIVEKIFNTFDTLDKKQNEYKAEVDCCADKKEIFEIARKRDREMREMLDDLFGKPISEPIFKSVNVYALADGLPIWCNFMLAIIDQIDTTFAREQKATNPRIKKYTEKWKK